MIHKYYSNPKIEFPLLNIVQAKQIIIFILIDRYIGWTVNSPVFEHLPVIEQCQL